MTKLDCTTIIINPRSVKHVYLSKCMSKSETILTSLFAQGPGKTRASIPCLYQGSNILATPAIKAAAV